MSFLAAYFDTALIGDTMSNLMTIIGAESTHRIEYSTNSLL